MRRPRRNRVDPYKDDFYKRVIELRRRVKAHLKKAASRDPKKIRDVLATAEFTGLTYPNPTVKFGPDGLNVNNKETLAEWIKGELRTVWPKENQAMAPLL